MCPQLLISRVKVSPCYLQLRDVTLWKATSGEFDRDGIFPQVQDLHETLAGRGRIHHRFLANAKIESGFFLIMQ